MNVHAQIQGQMLIGGEMVAGEANSWIESVNPANEEKIGEFPAGDATDVNKAVAAAEKAQPAWAALDIKERAKYLYKVAKRIRERGQELLHTEVIKPPETSSLSATILGEICKEVMPPGTVNIVSGYGMPAGDAIVRHPRVKRISFTGSIPTGMAIQRSAAESGIKALTLELGGKNPFIVYPDADADKAADAAIVGMNFAWSGQSCGSTSRLMLHETL